MSKKLFTFLGTTYYKPTVYYFNEDIIREEDYEELKTPYVQLPLCKELGYDTELIVCLTPEARDANWIPTNGKEGLKELLSKEGINAKSVDILKGENTDQLWNNFNKIFEEFEKDDEVYVDVTYSLRSIPIIFMSLLNYARAVKNINIKGIYYGALDVGKSINICEENLMLVPIFDLTFFGKIQDWARGAEKFLTTGDSRLLVNELSTKNLLSEICNRNVKNEVTLMETISENLKAYSENLLTCRGKKIASQGKKLKDELNKIKEITITDFAPFSKIISQICDSLELYNGEVINDSIYAIKQSRKFKLLQQAYTMLQETLITYLTVDIGLDYKERHQRKSAERIMKYFLYKENSNNKLTKKEEQLKAICNEKLMVEIGKIYKEIGDFRNDINHDGFSDKAKSYSTFENNLDAFIEKFERIVNDSYNPKNEENLPKKLISILSHELLNSQVDELKNSWNVEQIIILPEKLKSAWSNINPNDDLEDDFNLLYKLKTFILENTKQEDYVIVQGEWGMTFTVVNMCFELNRVPIYATTERKTKEVVRDGQVHSEKVFEHIRFRKYKI